MNKPYRILRERLTPTQRAKSRGYQDACQLPLAAAIALRDDLRAAGCALAEDRAYLNGVEEACETLRESRG